MAPTDRGRDDWFMLKPADDLSMRDMIAVGVAHGTLDLADLDTNMLDLLIDETWAATRRPSQIPPDWQWSVWLLQAGRGFGKTRVGAETMSEWAEAHGPGFRGACIGPTNFDVRNTMFEGESGLLRCLPPSMLRTGEIQGSYNRSTYEIFLIGDGKIQGYSSEAPDRLRGPQHHKAWADELAAWEDATAGPMNDTTWFHTMAGLRLPSHAGQPQCVVTTTPQPNALVKYLGSDKCTLKVARYRGSSMANLANLAEMFLDSVIRPALGTRMGRQEIFAEIIDDYGDVFDLENLRMVPRIPDDRSYTMIRYWDLAATEPHDKNVDPDWTVGTLAALDLRKFDQHVIADSVWMRKRPGTRNKMIRDVAIKDFEKYGKVTQWVEVDPGAGGKEMLATLQRDLDGIQPVKGNPVAGKGKKHERAELPAAAIEQGRVVFVEGTWNTAAMEQMGEMTTDDTHPHDDFVDTLSGIWSVIARTRKRRRAVGPTGESKESNTV